MNTIKSVNVPATMGRKAYSYYTCNGHICPLSNGSDMYDSMINRMYKEDQSVQAKKTAAENKQYTDTVNAYRETVKDTLNRIQVEYPDYTLAVGIDGTATLYNTSKKPIYINNITSEGYKIDFHATYDY